MTNTTDFIAPSGSIELDNSCKYSIDNRNTRSRETVVPAEDLAFYFKTYIVPKYGLENINVSNCASFMKDLEMNWTKLTPELKDKVLNIIVDDIFKTGNYDFKQKLIEKLNIDNKQQPVNLNKPSKSNFGNSISSNNFLMIGLGIVILFIVLILLDKFINPKI
jgi:hypothetical protein